MPSKVERWLASQAKKQEGTATDKIRADRAIDSGSEEFRVGAELDRYVGKASALAPYSPAPTTEQPTYVEQTPLERKEQTLVSAARQRAEKRKTAGDDYYKKEYGMTKAEYDKEYDAIDRMSAVREARSDMQEIEDTAKARTEEKVALAPLVKEYKDAFIGILPESAYAWHSPVGDKEEIKEDIVLDYLMTLPAEERYAQLEKAAYRSTIVPRIEALKEKATQFMNEESERITAMQKHVPVPSYSAAAGMQLGASGTWESPVEYLEDLYTSVKKDDFKSGFVEAADWRDFISFGLASLGGDAAKLQALQKARKGEPLTEKDEFFIEVAEIEQALEDFRKEKGGASFLNSLGSGAAHSSQFLTEMLMTGGLGGAAKVATSGIKQAFKQGVGRGLAHLAVKNVPKTLVYGAKRSPLMAGTYRNLMDRRINQYSVANGQVDLTNPESLWKSIGVAWADQTFEIASELWGNMLHLGFGKIGKAIGADKWLKTKSVNLKTTPAMRRIFRDGLLWSGDIPSEMTSEFLGDVATNLAYSAFNKDEQYWGELFTWNYWGNLLALTAGLKAGVTVASIPSIVDSNKKMKQLEARSAEAFNAIGNEELKNKVLNLGGRTDIEDVAEYMHSIEWSQYKPIEVAHAIDYMMSEVERQVVAGSESEQERAERYAPRLKRIKELAYLNAEGVAMPTMVTADVNFGADDTKSVTIIQGDYNNPEAMVWVRLADGTTKAVVGEKISNVQETDMASLVAEDYAMTFAEEDAMETLGEVEQTLFDMQRTGASNTQQIRAVEKAGLTVFNEGEVVTLLNGEEATVVEGFRHGLYTVMRADGSLSMVGVGGILQPDVAIAQAQRNAAMPQEQTPLTQSAPLPEGIDTTTDYATPDGFVGKAVDYNAESDQVTLQSADGGLTNVPRASLTTANAEQVTPQEDITENLATETISEMEQSEAEEAPMPVAPQTAPIPQNEDGSVDYESMTDATMYANALESDMGNVADAQEAVADVRQSKEAELAKLQEQKKQTANMNEKVALKQQEQKLVQQIAMLNEVENILGSRATAVEAETAQVNEAVETAPVAETTTEQTTPTTEPMRAIAEGIKENDFATQLRKENPAEYNTFNALAKLLGLEIEFVESAGEGNALIVGNKMQVAYNPTNREETLRFLIGHESLHRLKQVAPEAYAELIEDVKAHLGEELFGQRVERLRVRYEHQGIAITEESLEEEVVADFIGEMEEDYNVVSDLATQNPNKSWWQKLIEGLRNLFGFLEAAEADTTKVASILNKIETAYKTAAEKVQTLEVESNANNQIEEVKYSLVSERIETLFNEAIAGNLTGKPISIGTLTPEGKAYLEQISGLKFKDRVDFVLNPSDLIHIYNDHFGDNEKDKGKNIPLTKHDIKRIVDVISYPTQIIYGIDKKSNRKLFYFLMDSGYGAYNLLEIYSNKKGNLSTKTYYKTKKDAAQRVMDLKKSLLSTSETYSGAILSDTKIPQIFELPNIEPKYSLKDTFYSNAEFAVRNINQEKATPEQWLKMIEKNGGLKAGEDKWLGLSDWLKEQMRGSIKEKPTTININDTEYNVKELEEQILSDIKAMLEEAGFEDELIGIRLVGSYARGEQRPDSDIDVIVEYKGNSTEDTLFNVLNDEEHRINIGGVDVDINPITEGKSGTLDEWEKRNAGFTKKPITLTKDEVLQYIAENDIRIEEVEYGDVEDSARFKELYIEYNALYYEYGRNSERAFEVMLDNYGDDFGIAFEAAGDELWVRDSEAAEVFVDINSVNDTRLQYTTDGLTNKKEIALVVPTIEPWNTSDNIHFGDAGEGRAVAWIRFGETEAPKNVPMHQRVDAFDAPFKNVAGYDVYAPEGRGGKFSKDYVIYGKLKDGSEAYIAYIGTKPISKYETLEEARNAMNEYYEANPRMVTRYERILVIDEIQSKRHQDGREKGYKTVEDEELKNAQGAEIWAMMQKYNVSRPADLRSVVSTEDAARLDELTQYKFGEVPSAPFEKNWAELAMKRMLRYAAENGFDKVAWTTGEQQADRYSLVKKYDYIEREDNPSVKGKRFVLAGGNYDNFVVDDNAIVISSSISEAEGKPLVDLVGKDMAEKMMSLDDGDTISGDGLNIGGSGMKAFYDQMLPSFMRKYAKKWGATVGEVTMPNLEENNTMHSVDVTPAMRESVMQGQPMFSLRNPEWQSQFGVPLADGKELSLEDVRTIFERTNKRKFYQKMFDKVYAVMEKLPRKVIKVVEELPDKRDVLGTASTKGDVTYLTVLFKDYGEQVIAEVLLHELIHSVTTYATHAYAYQAKGDNYAKAYDALPAEIKKACRELQSVYNRLSKKNDLKGAYGIKNIHEMLAELSNPQFRTLVKEGGFWKVLLNALKRMFGFEGTYNAELKELDNILSSFLENYNEEAYMDAVESIYQREVFPTTIEEVDAKEVDAYSDMMYSLREKDTKTLDMLNNGETIKVYRAMQVIDGKLYPPMSAKVDGKMREPIELGVWERAEERPDLADAKGYFKLDKGNKSSLKARYNPYIHTSLTPLNDQFSSAQDRPNLVTVEVEIPASELTSGYKAEKAKDAVGKLEWKAGVVQSQLSGTRTVILSRWDRPLRIVPDSEVAQRIVEMFGDKEVVMPSNVVTPSLRAELEKLGIPFKETDNQGKEVKYSLTDKQAVAIIEAMKANAEVAPEIELTPENWIAEFGTEGVISTPIGEVKMGDGQYQKLIDQKREQYFGCIKPTLNDPDIILEEYDAKEGAERDTKMLFVKTFVKPNRRRYVHFASVTVRKDNLEVSISSHEVKEKKIKEKMHNDSVVHLNETLLDSEWRLTKPQSEGSDLVPTPSVISNGKDTTSMPNMQENEVKNSLKSLDAPYLDAVARGDMATAERLVREAAAIAMPNTMVVDEDGLPKVVYHQTNANVYINRETGQNWDELDWRERMEWDERDDWNEYWEEQDFNTFSRVNARTTNEFDGFFFAPEYDEYHEYGDRTIRAFLDIRKPASREDYNIDASKNDAGRDERIRLQSEGYDGVIREEDGTIWEYIAFEPNQIKSADVVTYDDAGNIIPLSERFNPEKEDIRYSLREATGEKLTPAMIRHHMMENVTRHHEQEVNRINRFYDREERQAKALAKKARKEAGLVYPKNGKITDRLAFLIPDGKTTLPMELQVTYDIANGLKLKWSDSKDGRKHGLSSELGLGSSRKEGYGAITVGATMYVEDYVAQLMEENNGYSRDLDDNDIRNAVINVLSQYTKPKQAIQALEDIFLSNEMDDAEAEALYKIDLRRQEALEEENARYEGLKTSYERNPRAFERDYFEQMEKDVVALNFKEREIRRLKRDIKALRNTHNKTYREQAERIQKVREAIDDFLKSTFGRNISTTEVKRLFDALQKATTQKQLERVIEAVSRMEKRTTDRIEQERKRRLLKMKLSFFIPADAMSLEEYLKDENQKASDAAAIIDYYNTENSDPVMNTFRIALKDRYKGKDSSGVSVAKLIDAETAEIMAFISTNATRRDIVEANLAEETAKLYEAKEKLKGKLPFSQSTMDKIDQAYEVVLDYWEADIKRQGAISYNKAMRELSIEIEIAKKKRDEAQLAGSDELYELAVAEVAGLMNEARELAESHYDGMGKANKILIEANDAVERLLLGGRRLLSEEREAKRKHDAEVLRDAINDITNYGEEYKELNAKAHDQRKASKDKEPSRLKRIHSEWADSLEYLLNVMAPYAPEGSGLTYQRIIGGALGAASTLYSNTQVVNMAVVGAIKRIWGGKMKHNTLPKLLNQSQQIVLAENYAIGYYEETEDGKKVKKPRRWCLTMGNAIYLLAMWEQPDSHYKLTANGVTQEVIDDVTSLIANKDARWIEFKNWVVDELLPARREVYDETHRKVQGTYMAESKNYFPIHILSQDRHQEEKASEEKAQQRSIKPSGIKQRVYNTNMIDLNVDFVKALMDNLYTMEMWAAIAPVEEDMNVILSNNTAKNLMNAKFGADFSQRLKTAMQVTVGTLTSGYINSTEKFFQDLTRRWGGTKIAFGINTALKQLAGAGAMCVYTADLRFLWYLAKNIQFLFTPKSAQEFFPMLQKRWEEGLAGNIGLKELFRSDVTTSSGFAIATENVNRVTTDIVKLGMIPNKIVDMAVCAMMAKSVYEYEYNRYIKQGYSKEMAEKKAMIDAESSYNKTQQSSEMAFLSSGQVSSNILYRSLNIFMNNSIANYRIGVMGIEDIKRGLFRFKKAQRNMRKATERRLFEQYTASGMAEEEARAKAQQEADIITSKLSRSSFVAKGIFRSLWGFYFANIVFGFMGIAPYLLFGDDDDKKEELIIDLLKSSIWTPLTLIPTTKALYETFAYAWKSSEEGRGYQVSIAESLFPMLEDVDQLITNSVGVGADIADGGDMSYAQIYNTIDALLRMGVGVDTNRMFAITDGFIDLGNGDWLEGTLDVLSVPKSQIKLLTGDRKEGETAKEYMTRVMRTMSIVDKNKIDVAELENYNFELGKWEKPTNISAAEKRKVSEIYRQYQAEYKKDMLKRCSEEVRTDYPEIVEKHAEILKDMGVRDTKLALVRYYEQIVDTLKPEAASALERLAVLQAEISATERSLDLLVSQDGKEYIDLLTEEFNLRKEFVAQYEIYKNLTE